MASIRLFDPKCDYPAFADLCNRVNPEYPVTGNYLEEQDKIGDWEPQQREAAWVGDRLVGTGRCSHPPWLGSHELNIATIVDPEYRRQGIGSALYDRALVFARGYETRRVHSWIEENAPESLTFAEHRGFVVDRHLFTSTLNISEFDGRPYAAVVEQVKASGIHFQTMADFGDTPENRRRFYDLYVQLVKDVPNIPSPFDFDNFQASLYTNPVLDGLIFALEGERWVGFAALSRETETALHHFMTGVGLAYRGRQIALALKLMTIDCARQHNAVQLNTENDSTNAPMLAINRKLGYQPQPGSYAVVLDLTPQARST